MKNIFNSIKHMFIDVWDAILSYFTVFVGFISSVDLMDAGAGILLIIRLLIDVPKLYRSWIGKGGK